MPSGEATTAVLETVWQRLACFFRATAEAVDYDPIEHHEARIEALERRVAVLTSLAEGGYPPSRTDTENRVNLMTKGNTDDAD